MTEIFVLILVSGCLLLILGVSATTLLYVFMCVLEVLFLICTAFFIISLFFVLISKKTQALCIGIAAKDTEETSFTKKKNNSVKYAVYEIDGVPCLNLYPTDIISQRMLKVGRPANITVAHIGNNKKTIVLDTPSLITIGTGLPLFLIMSGILGYLLLSYL